MFDKLKNKLSSGKFSSSKLSKSEELVSAPAGTAITKQQIYESRTNFGVNLGSLFVQEKYIYNELFPEGTEFELDAVKENVKEKGEDSTRKLFEDHWINYLNDDDWNWLHDKGVQSLRIPIGYWSFLRQVNADGTSFDSVSGVYANSWDIFKKNYIEKAAEYSISVLVDLHALPKGANTGAHSGEKLDKAGFWDDSKSQSLACDILKFIASDLEKSKYENVSGLQIVNESEFSEKAIQQKKYYINAIQAIRSVNKHVPIVFSDGWWPNQWSTWIKEISNDGKLDYGLVLDSHVYRCFSDQDKSESVDEIINNLDKSCLCGLEYPIDILVGEYSCVLDGASWSKSGSDNRAEKVKQYGNTLCNLFKTRSRAGNYFWCFKFQNGDGGEWGFYPMVEKGCVPSRSNGFNLPSEDDFNKNLNENLTNHINYWKKANSNETYEHWRYKEGFTTGWADSMEFGKFNSSKIGRVNSWKFARRNEHIAAKGDSRFIWEWEQGFQVAVDYFNGL